MSQTAFLKLPVARCGSCNESESCPRCRESNISKLRRRWHTEERSDEFDKDMFERLFVLRYGRESVGTAMYHKYFTSFSRSMKWQKESLGQYIDAICQGKLEEMSLASTFVPVDALSQLSTEELLGRCTELTRHLQKLHNELAVRHHAEALADSDTESDYSDVEFEEVHLSPRFGTPVAATQLSTPPSSQPPSSVPEDHHLRKLILMHWPEEKNFHASRFVRMPLHTPRFLVVLLDLARYYTWEQTTRMVSYVIIERVRHFRNSEDKSRYPKLDDWQKVLKICQSLGFPALDLEKLYDNDMLAINFRNTGRGLVKEGNSFHPRAEEMGLCIERGPSCQPWRVGPQIFTRKYMMRCSKQNTS